MSSGGASRVKPLFMSEPTEIVARDICEKLKKAVFEHTKNPPYKLRFKSHDQNIAICPDTSNVYVLSEQILGEGGQGKILLAQNLADNKLVVAKIQTSQSLGASYPHSVKKERENLDQHQRLIDKCDVIEDNGDETAITFMPYFHGIDLLDFLYEVNHDEPKESVNRYVSKRILTVAEKVRLFKFALRELIELHQNGLAHGDLKPSNFVINTEKFGPLWRDMRLVDLGSAINMRIGEIFKNICGSFGYIPQDCYLSPPIPYDFYSDYFSFGLVLCEILSEKPYEYFIRQRLHELREKQKQSEAIIEPITETEIYSYFPEFFTDAGVDEFVSKFDDKEDKGTIHGLILFIRTLCQPYEKRALRGSPEHLDSFYKSLNTAEMFTLERCNSVMLRRHTPRESIPLPSSSTSSNEEMLIPPLSPRYTPKSDAGRAKSIRKSDTRVRSQTAPQALEQVFSELSLSSPKKG